jgi:hypothetical protein
MYPASSLKPELYRMIANPVPSACGWIGIGFRSVKRGTWMP